MKNGFTLIELLIAISIIAVLSTIGLSTFSGIQSRARDSVRKNDLNTLATALELYFQNHGKYIAGVGSCSDGTSNSTFNDDIKQYLKSGLPQDPKVDNPPYCYEAVDGGLNYKLYAKLENCSSCALGRYNYTLTSEDFIASTNPPPPQPPPSSQPSSQPTPPPPPNPKRVFVTSTTYNGNLGGLSGADAKCQTRANAASLRGTWKAWVTDGALEELGSPPFRFNKSTVPYVLVDSTTVANDWTDLITLKGSIFLRHAINLTELGQSVENPKSAWTGTKADGGYYSNAMYHCNSWTSANSGSSGAIGFTDSTMAAWSSTSDASVSRCDEQMRLYCFEQ